MKLELTLWMIGAYLYGAVPFGLVVAKVMGGRDPRFSGSGNIGATNVGRTLGKKAGIITLLLDLLKGFLPTFAVAVIFKDPLAVALVGISAFLGHVYPVYLRFKGGKGIATAAGVFLAASPLGLLILAAVFGVVVGVWRMVGLGSVVAAALLPIIAAILKSDFEIICLGAAIAVVAIWKHRENIKRIISGTEPRLGGKA